MACNDIWSAVKKEKKCFPKFLHPISKKLKWTLSMIFGCLSYQLLMKIKTQLYIQLIFSLKLFKYAWVQPYRWDWPVIDDFLAVQVFLNSILNSIIQISIHLRNNWIINF